MPRNRDPGHAARRRAGFTLIELMVSMVVLSLVALLMMGGLRFVLRAMASTDNRREAMEELTLGLSVLRGELERAEPLMVKVGNRDLVLFSGEPDRLRFANVEPPYLGGLPYLTYEYAVVPDGNGYRIELRRGPLDPAAPDLAAVDGVEPRTVLRVGPELHFSYFGPLGKNDPPSWRKAWPPGPKLPQAIRLAEGDDPGWPELVVPLRIAAPYYCGASEADKTAGCKVSGEPEGGGLLKPDENAASSLGTPKVGERKPFGEATQ
jgi:general secretion pathway protein J